MLYNLEKELRTFKKEKVKRVFNEYGIIISIQDGVALATGLKKVGLSEIVQFQSGINGMVSTLERDITRISLMGPDSAVQPGDTVYRLKNLLKYLLEMAY
jgi:F-type H+-transporting ATPase subunit alpha